MNYFDYMHILYGKPAISPPVDDVLHRRCNCGVEFVTSCRGRKYCDACKVIAAQRATERANARKRAQRIKK